MCVNGHQRMAGLLRQEGFPTTMGAVRRERKGRPDMTLVTVFGGTGFLGRHVVECLIHEGAVVRIAARHPKWIDLSAGVERSVRAMFAAAETRPGGSWPVQVLLFSAATKCSARLSIAKYDADTAALVNGASHCSTGVWGSGVQTVRDKAAIAIFNPGAGREPCGRPIHFRSPIKV